MTRGMKWRVGRLHLAGALAIVAAIAFVFASVAIADEAGPSEYPPPPPSPIAPPDWDFGEGGFMPYLGDANLDEFVDVGDVILIRQYSVGATLTPEQYRAADATGDGVVDVGDVIRLRQYSVDPYATSGVLAELMWNWNILPHQSLRDPLGQNAG